VVSVPGLHLDRQSVSGSVSQAYTEWCSEHWAWQPQSVFAATQTNLNKPCLGIPWLISKQVFGDTMLCGFWLWSFGPNKWSIGDAVHPQGAQTWAQEGCKLQVGVCEYCWSYTSWDKSVLCLCWALCTEEGAEMTSSRRKRAAAGAVVIRMYLCFLLFGIVH
jgi:hypothetical protein